MSKKNSPSVFEVVHAAALSGEDLDDAEIYRRAGLNPDDFYHGEEAAERFEIGLRATLGQKPRTEREAAILKDIIRNIDKANPGMRRTEQQKVGGSWGDGVTAKDRREKVKRATTKRQREERGAR